ncbi:hypothetical protein MCOR27_007739 [Pyricularia oryzae]|nr:hypothetical protein MCOR26_008430 [Pyricularia oryzae]KAI6273681.1 hypothetical protein MCOR27_007739 [Pyricularia oryzae]KAI6295823.1 hypothetical protein MCOR29_011377 [Pyricularia oryzae]KAI6318524.1 hypothetical protein MCOR34_003530 [Pyricularia oryzae]KAI6320607.1 hypothetical protein MCOR30_008167 [Pyricularia oryzae]
MATAASSVAPVVTLYHADQAAHFPSNSTLPITEIHKDDLESQLNENKRSVSVNIGINPAQSQEVTPTGPIPPPEITDTIEIDENVVKAFPDKGAKVLGAVGYGKSLWGITARIEVELPDGRKRKYFMKALKQGELSRVICEGELRSLQEIYKTSPGFCPEPYGWGRFASDPEMYFLLVEFRDIGASPAEPSKLAASLARLHSNSQSPTGKFGFGMRTCHTLIDQAVDFWSDSWAAVYGSHLRHVVELAKPFVKWPEFDIVADLTVDKVVPRLLLPLQAGGRTLKPCLVHGDCWDGNTAMDGKTGEAFIFDVCSFYAHNEYDTGNWRTPRHRLSNPAYIKAYKKLIRPSEPAEEWEARNILYSLPFNLGNVMFVPGSTQRQVI